MHYWINGRWIVPEVSECSQDLCLPVPFTLSSNDQFQTTYNQSYLSLSVSSISLTCAGAKKLRTLLCELPKILWEGTKWKPVDMGDVMDPKRVRLIYYKAMRIVHPDKLKADASPEQKVCGFTFVSLELAPRTKTPGRTCVDPCPTHLTRVIFLLLWTFCRFVPNEFSMRSTILGRYSRRKSCEALTGEDCPTVSSGTSVHHRIMPEHNK